MEFYLQLISSYSFLCFFPMQFQDNSIWQSNAFPGKCWKKKVYFINLILIRNQLLHKLYILLWHEFKWPRNNIIRKLIINLKKKQLFLIALLKWFLHYISMSLTFDPFFYNVRLERKKITFFVVFFCWLIFLKFPANGKTMKLVLEIFNMNPCSNEQFRSRIL